MDRACLPAPTSHSRRRCQLPLPLSLARLVVIAKRYDVKRNNNQFKPSLRPSFASPFSISSSPSIAHSPGSVDPLRHPQKLQSSHPSWHLPPRTLDQPVRLGGRRHPTSSCSSSVTRLSVSTRVQQCTRVTRRSPLLVRPIVAFRRLQSGHPPVSHLH
jgi:hypothetical protein